MGNLPFSLEAYMQAFSMSTCTIILRMQTRFTILLLAGSAILGAQSPKLPADIDPQSYSRLPLIQRRQLDANGQRVYDVFNAKDQAAPRLGPVAALLYSLGVTEPFEQLNASVRKSKVGPRYFEICTLIAARVFDQQYVWSGHELAAARAGVEPSVIDAIKFNRSVERLADKDAAVIHFGRDLLRQHKVSSPLYAKVVELFGRQGMVELTVILGDYAMTSILLDAVDQQPPPGREGVLLPVK
jgi:4-carboxymuconolactone decarboxylase